METDFTNSWAVQKLADFLAGINTSDVEREVFDTAAEMAADALDAELGAIEGEGVLLACFGAGTSSDCLLYTSPSPRDGLLSRMPSSA